MYDLGPHKISDEEMKKMLILDEIEHVLGAKKVEHQE